MKVESSGDSSDLILVQIIENWSTGPIDQVVCFEELNVLFALSHNSTKSTPNPIYINSPTADIHKSSDFSSKSSYSFKSKSFSNSHIFVYDLDSLEFRLHLGRVKNPSFMCASRTIEYKPEESLGSSSRRAHKNMEFVDLDDDIDAGSSTPSSAYSESSSMAQFRPGTNSASEYLRFVNQKLGNDSSLNYSDKSELSDERNPESLIAESLKSETGPVVPNMISRLYVACRKKICIFEWNDPEYRGSREILLPWMTGKDMVRNMEWVDASKHQKPGLKRNSPGNLCCALFNNKYILIGVKNSEDEQSKETTVKYLCDAHGKINARGSMKSSKSDDTIMRMFQGSDKSVIPLVTKVPSGDEVIITKDSTSYFKNSDGRPSRKYGVQWSNYPKQIIYDFPYLIGIFGADMKSRNNSSESLPEMDGSFGIEVRSLLTLDISQSIKIDHCNVLAAKNGRMAPIFASNGFQAWILTQNDLELQIEQLVSTNQFEESLLLLDQYDSLSEGDKQSRKVFIKVAEAIQLFCRLGKYEAALNIMEELNLDPSGIILSLYPELRPGFMDFEFHLNDQDAPDIINNSTQSAHSGRYKVFIPLEAYLFSKPDLSLVDENESKVALMRYLTNLRSNLLKVKFSKSGIFSTSENIQTADGLAVKPVLPASGETYVHVRSDTHSSVESSDSTLGQTISDLNFDELEEILRVIDTTLFKTYVEINPSLVGSLLRVTNSVDVEEAEQILKELNKINDLMNLYYGKNLHRKALSILEDRLQSAKIPKGQMDSVNSIVGYLNKLGTEHLETIFEFAKEPLLKYPNLAIGIFINEDLESIEKAKARYLTSKISEADYKNTDSTVKYPKTQVLSFLEKFSKNCAVKYLEYLIFICLDKTPEYHNKLALYYLQEIHQFEEVAFKSESLLNDRKISLHKFLQNSDFYKPERILRYLPKDSLYEERAVVYSKLGMHEEALEIFVNKVKSFSRLEKYCDRVWTRKNRVKDDLGKDSESIYLVALKVSIKSNSCSESNEIISSILNLIAKYPSRINFQRALEILPMDTPLSHVAKFLQNSLSNLCGNINDAMLGKNLAKSILDQKKVEKFKLSRRKVLIDDQTLCEVCHHRIGDSGFFLCSELGTEALNSIERNPFFENSNRIILKGQKVFHYACRKLG